ncbi:beta-ketoacyl synthase N-terminal-like domain-containing protein [Capnocytophaga cynodegmi]|uniref:Beta-ketoacyl-ACP synthase II n=1 Tax=Capnocytophaga cynodegmi TaxID=28189 RepID=A0A0B7HSP7_9FLAO|nr:beta-ketoacyl synthase N-terminal-like domain-containing protein [Capnocytophaga cynodegmi]CEN40952.1 Beta-ketoacyl-ACP synthase II [Capnocytophaga cynodegmi]CEN42255.1 Beta-ketoacyl-ACP synthase II [Capnocytophaga cynodegmi]
MELNSDVRISITGMGSVSALGNSLEEITQSYENNKTHISVNNSIPMARLSESSHLEVENLRHSIESYKSLDASVLYAICASRKAVSQAGWQDVQFGINIGSSRGATSLFEEHYSYFSKNQKCMTLASPTTTLGNIATWVGQDLKATGFEMSHSITCSTALHAVANGIAWLKSRMENRFLVGGSEDPLTPFTIAQAQALKIYSNLRDDFPCKAMDITKKQNTMVLGEGAGVFCLEEGAKEQRLALITGLGFATEKLTHSVSLSANGECLQKSMRIALENTSLEEIDVVVTHTPGTIKGDLAEITAIREVFADKTPILTNNKWKIGHTYGASGALSLEMAILMLQNQTFYGVPYIENQKSVPHKIRKVLINAVGFGGNAISLLIEK